MSKPVCYDPLCETHNKPVVGRINFSPTGERSGWSDMQIIERFEALASGLGQLSSVLSVIDGRLTEMTKQLDRMENRRWRETNQ